MDNVKVGYKTTEFWLTIAAMLIGFLVSSGTFGPEQCDAMWCGVASKVLGVAAAVLASMGYAASRAVTKSGVLARLLGRG